MAVRELTLTAEQRAALRPHAGHDTGWAGGAEGRIQMHCKPCSVLIAEAPPEVIARYLLDAPWMPDALLVSSEAFLLSTKLRIPTATYAAVELASARLMQERIAMDDGPVAAALVEKLADVLLAMGRRERGGVVAGLEGYA